MKYKCQKRRIKLKFEINLGTLILAVIVAYLIAHFM